MDGRVSPQEFAKPRTRRGLALARSPISRRHGVVLGFPKTRRTTPGSPRGAWTRGRAIRRRRAARRALLRAGLRLRALQSGPDERETTPRSEDRATRPESRFRSA